MKISVLKCSNAIRYSVTHPARLWTNTTNHGYKLQLMLLSESTISKIFYWNLRWRSNTDFQKYSWSWNLIFADPNYQDYIFTGSASTNGSAQPFLKSLKVVHTAIHCDEKHFVLKRRRALQLIWQRWHLSLKIDVEYLFGFLIALLSWWRTTEESVADR